MFRLPAHADAHGLDIAIVGVPLDIGTSNRSGSRFGPRQIRSESVLVRPYGMATRAAPFDSSLGTSLGLAELHYPPDPIRWSTSWDLGSRHATDHAIAPDTEDQAIDGLPLGFACASDRLVAATLPPRLTPNSPEPSHTDRSQLPKLSA